jgi:hypothetical protein
LYENSFVNPAFTSSSISPVILIPEPTAKIRSPQAPEPGIDWMKYILMVSLEAAGSGMNRKVGIGGGVKVAVGVGVSVSAGVCV